MIKTGFDASMSSERMGDSQDQSKAVVSNYKLKF